MMEPRSLSPDQQKHACHQNHTEIAAGGKIDQSLKEWSRIMFSNGKWVFKRRFRRMLGKLPNSASMFSPTDLSERPQALFLGEMENLLRCEDEKTN